MRNRKLDVGSVTNMVTQKKTVSHHAGIANFQDIAIGIVLKEKIEEEVRVEEEEEMNPLLGKEGSHQNEGDIHPIQKEKERKRETKVIGLETTVLVSQVQTRTGQVDLCQDLILAQKQNKTLHQGEKSQKEVEDQTETKADTIRVIEW